MYDVYGQTVRYAHAIAFFESRVVSMKEHRSVHFMLECGYPIIADCGTNVVRALHPGTIMIYVIPMHKDVFRV